MSHEHEKLDLEQTALQLADTQAEIARIESEVITATANLQTQLVSLREKDAEVREAIRQAMEANSVKKFENDQISITYVAESERVGVDTTKLKTLHPDIYEKMKKITKVRSQVRIKVKE